MKTGTVRFVIPEGHPHYGRKVVVVGGVKFRNNVAKVSAEDAAKIEPILVKFHNIGIEGTSAHEEFVRLYAGAAKATSQKAKLKAVEDAHEKIEQEKFNQKLEAVFGDDDEDDDLAEIDGVKSGTPSVPGATPPA